MHLFSLALVEILEDSRADSIEHNTESEVMFITLAKNQIRTETPSPAEYTSPDSV